MSVVNMYLGMSTYVNFVLHMFMDWCRLCFTHFVLIYVDWVAYFLYACVDCVAHISYRFMSIVLHVSCQLVFLMSNALCRLCLSIMLIDLCFSRWCLSIVSIGYTNVQEYFHVLDVTRGDSHCFEGEKTRWSSFQFLHNVFFSRFIVCYLRRCCRKFDVH